MSTLEQRYRRLIALYPAWHRRRYEAEMLSTLMDGASEQQRAPRLREAVDLLRNAVRLRFDPRGVPRGRDSRWQDAAGVFAVLAALTLSAMHVLRPLAYLGWWQRAQRLQPGIDMPWHSVGLSTAVGACWLLVAIVALIRWRIAAAVLAWATVLAFTGWLLIGQARHPQLLVNAWPSIVCGVSIAACLSVPATQPARQLLGRWLVLLFGAGAAAVGSSIWLDAMLAKIVIYGPGLGGSVDNWGVNFPGIPSVDTGVDTIGSAPLLIYVAFLVVLIWVLARVGAPVRRRLFALGAGPIATLAIVWTAYVDAGYLGGNPSATRYVVMPHPPTIGQWLVLLFLPLVVFCVAVILVRRADAREDLIASDRLHRQKLVH